MRIYVMAIVGVIALVATPAITLLMLNKLPLVTTVFSTLTAWLGIVILGWSGGLFCVVALDKWRETRGQLLSDHGLSPQLQQAVLWFYVNMPLLIGLSLFVVTLIDTASLGRALLAQKILVLSIGFIPLWAYGFHRATQITMSVAERHRTGPIVVPTKYMSTKWRYGIVLFANVVTTPFFGSAAIAGDLWRHVPGSRRVGVPIIVGVSMFGTLALKPIFTQMRQGEPEVLLFYLTFALFTAVMQILVWKAFTGPHSIRNEKR